MHVQDDHEIDNDWASNDPEDNQTSAEFLERRRIGTQILYDHQPLLSKPNGPRLQFYKTIGFGRLANIFLLDTRQFRSDQSCGGGVRANPPVPEDCDERLDENLDMLGPHQEQWLNYGLRSSRTTWNGIASSVWFSQFYYANADGRNKINTDSWDGYPVARQRIIDRIHSLDNNQGSTVMLSGDWHVFGALQVLKDFDDPDSDIVAAEFGGTSITGVGAWAPIMKANLGLNPHVVYVEGDDLRNGINIHGYAICNVTKDKWTTTFKALDNVKEEDSGIYELAKFEVAYGDPTIVPVNVSVV